jgi:putative membrane protein
MKKICEMILIAGLTGVSFGALADESMASNSAAMNMNNTNAPVMLTPQQFVLDATAGGRLEVRLGEIAQGKTQNADVRHFADRMVRDHTKANERLMTIAYGEGLSCEPTNLFSIDDANWNYPVLANPGVLKEGQMLTMTNLPYLGDYQTIQRLEALSGAQFDQAYAMEMVTEHTNAISQFETASQTLTDPKLKRFAERTLPTLREHYEMAQDLVNKVGAANANQAAVQPQAPIAGGGM